MPRCLDDSPRIFFQLELVRAPWRPAPPRDVDTPTFTSRPPFLARDALRRMDAGTSGPPPSFGLAGRALRGPQPRASLRPRTPPPPPPPPPRPPTLAAAARARPLRGQPGGRAHACCAAGPSRPLGCSVSARPGLPGARGRTGGGRALRQGRRWGGGCEGPDIIYALLGKGKKRTRSGR